MCKSRPPVPVNVTLFSNRISAGITKLRNLIWDQLGSTVGSKSNDGHVYNWKERDIWHIWGMYKEKTELESCCHRQGIQEPPETGRVRKDFLLQTWRDCSPTNTLIPDFWPPELWEDTFFFIWSHQVVMICYHSPRKLINSIFKGNFWFLLKLFSGWKILSVNWKYPNPRLLDTITVIKRLLTSNYLRRK